MSGRLLPCRASGPTRALLSCPGLPYILFRQDTRKKTFLRNLLRITRNRGRVNVFQYGFGNRLYPDRSAFEPLAAGVFDSAKSSLPPIRPHASSSSLLPQVPTWFEGSRNSPDGSRHATTWILSLARTPVSTVSSRPARANDPKRPSQPAPVFFATFDPSGIHIVGCTVVASYTSGFPSPSVNPNR